jgi:hypothetical protein
VRERQHHEEEDTCMLYWEEEEDLQNTIRIEAMCERM